MIYSEIEEYINSIKKVGILLGLERIKIVLDYMGNPQDNLKYIHVAGTNGKGSVCTMLSSVFVEEGLKTGLFTSPYLNTMREYFVINGKIVKDKNLVLLFEIVKEAMDNTKQQLTEFEIMTVIMFKYFSDEKCDIVVLETGLGGTEDATNIIKTPLISVITNIGIDHVSFLGNDIASIARHKAGIIKQNGNIVSYEHITRVKNIIDEKCNEVNASITYANFSAISLINENLESQVFSYKEYENLEISLLGEFQRKNTAVVLEVIDIYNKINSNKVKTSSIYSGLKKASISSRFEILHKNPYFILDGSHNVQCVDEVLKTLSSLFFDKKIIFIVGVMKDKDYTKIAEKLSMVATEIITVSPQNERALSSLKLKKCFYNYCERVYSTKSILNAVELAFLRAEYSEAVICAMGSLYMAFDIKKSVEKIVKEVCL